MKSDHVRLRDPDHVWTTSGKRTDPIEDIDRLQAPVGAATVTALRGRIEAELDLIVESNRERWIAARERAAASVQLIEQRLTGLGADLAAISHDLDCCDPVRALAILVLVPSVMTCLGAEFAWTFQTLPFLLDLPRWSGLGIAVSALPVAAVTAMEWALVALFVDRVHAFRSAVHAGRVTARWVVITGLVGSCRAGCWCWP